MRQGRDVDVVSIGTATLAASRMIQHQLQMTLSDNPPASPTQMTASADPAASRTPGTVRLHQYDFENHQSDVDRAVKDLLSKVQNGTLCVLIDEAIILYTRTSR